MKGLIYMRPSNNPNARTKQLCVLITPEVDEGFKKITYLEQTSANLKAFQLIKQYVEEHQEQVELYDKLFSQNK